MPTSTHSLHGSVMVISSAKTIIVALIDTIDPTWHELVLLHTVSEMIAASRNSDAHLGILLLIVLKFLGERLDHLGDLVLLPGGGRRGEDIFSRAVRLLILELAG